MHYVAHAQACTSVEQAIKCDFREPGVDILVLGKESILEFYALDPTGLQLIHKESIHGQILDLKAWKQPGAETSVIAVLTAYPDLFVISTGGDDSFLQTVTSVSLTERSGRPAEHVKCLSIDFHCRCLLAHYYAGLIRIFPLGKEQRKRGRRSYTAAIKKEKEKKDEEFNLKDEIDLERGYNIVIHDLDVYAFVLLSLPISHPPTIGLIVQHDYGNSRVFKTYGIDLLSSDLFSDNQVRTKKSVRLEDSGSNTIIPITSSTISIADDDEPVEKMEGVVIVGEEKAVWITILEEEGEKKVKDSTKRKRGDTLERTIGTAVPFGTITATCQVEGNRNQFVLGDLYGAFYTLNIERSTDQQEKILSLEIENLGLTSSAKCIVYLQNQYLFVGSHFGDSQLIRLPVKQGNVDDMDVDGMPITVGNKGKGKGVQKLETICNFTNLAPIYDFRVVDIDGVGHSHVVTCSGGYGQGSMRIVRQGVALNELASFDFEDVQKCWNFRAGNAGQVDYLLLSSTYDSRILAFTPSSSEDEDSGVEELEELANFIFDGPTLAVLSLCQDALIQILASEVRIVKINNGSFEVGSSWEHPQGKRITMAATEGQYLALVADGGELNLLQLSDNTLKMVKSRVVSNELACISMSTVHGQIVLATGLWTVHSVCLFSVPDLLLHKEQEIETKFPLRSIEMAIFNSVPYLFVGTGDGTLIHYQLDPAIVPVPSSRKHISLGTQAVTFTSFDTLEGPVIMAACDQPAIISQTAGKFNYTAVALKDVISVAKFDSVNYPSCLIFVVPGGIRIGKFDQLEKLHVRTISLGEHEPKFMTYLPSITSYLVICYKTLLDRDQGEEIETSSVRLIDALSFEDKWSFELEEDELGRSIELIRDFSGEHIAIVGTQSACSLPGESKNGRILGFKVGKSGTLELVGDMKTHGTVTALCALQDGYFAAGINSRVLIFSTSGSAPFHRVASWGGAFLVISLSRIPDSTSFIVGDLFRSIILLNFNTETRQLGEVARDIQLNMTTATEVLNWNTFIGTEADLNIFTVEQPGRKEGSNDLAEDNLMLRGAFHLGEMVNKIRKGSMVPQFGDKATFKTLLYGTSAGALGVIIDLDEESSRILSQVERNMMNVLSTTGNLDIRRFRTFKQDSRTMDPIGFIDGDFVERFSQLSDEDVERVMKGASEHERLEESKEEIMSLIEDMIRLH